MESQAYVGTIGNHIFCTEWKYIDMDGILTPGGTAIVCCPVCGGAEHLSGVEYPETMTVCPECGATIGS